MKTWAKDKIIPYRNFQRPPIDIPDIVRKRIQTPSIRGGQHKVGKKATGYSNLQAFEAIVDVNGHGDYTNIQSALDAGNKRIFVRGGTYTLTSDITLDDDVLIQGESKYNTIIDLNGDHQIKAVGDTPYTTGTIAVTHGSVTITGTGTAWLSNLAVGDFIVFNGNVYKIVSVNTDTSLTIDIVYEGKSESGISYNAGTFKNNIYIKDLTIRGQSGLTSGKGAVSFHGVVNSGVDNCIINKNDPGHSSGIYLNHSYNNSLSNVNTDNGGYVGILLEYSHNNSLSNISANNSTDKDVYLYYSNNNSLFNINTNSGVEGLLMYYSDYNFFSGINNNNGVWGIGVLYSNNNLFSNIDVNNNEYDGIYLDRSNNNSFSNINVSNNNEYGFDLNHSNNNSFSNINVSNSGKGNVIIASSYNIIQGVLKNNSQAASGYNEISITKSELTFSRNNIITVNIYEDAANRGYNGVSEYEPGPAWAASTAYSVDDVVRPTTNNGYGYKCTVAGTSGTSEPTWPTTVGDTVTDGGVTWECIRGNDYNLIHGCIIQGTSYGYFLYGARSVAADNIIV